MADEDSLDSDDKRPPPAQIPLLEDIVDTGEPRNPARRPTRRSHYSLDLDLDPPAPSTPDLFTPHTADEPHHRTPPPADYFDASPLPASDVPWSVVDNQLPVEPVPGESKAQKEERLRASASRVVDDLVREYSHEIVRRLRDELTSLLDELEEGKDANRRD